MALKSPRRGVQSIRRHYSAALGSFPSRSFYVDATLGNDANSGTHPDEAWQTIPRVNSEAFIPGDWTRFKRGETWSGTQLTADNSGVVGNPVTYGAYGSGARPQIQNPGAPLSYTECIVITADYITIRDLEVSDAHFVGIDLDSAALPTGIIIQNCEITDVGAGAFINGNNNLVTGCYIHDLNMIIDDAAPGNDYGAAGIWLYRGSNNEVSYNTFLNCRAPSTDFGFDGGAVELFGFVNMSGHRIHHNWVEGCEGFIEVGSSGIRTISDIVVHHNVIRDSYWMTFMNNVGAFQVNTSDFFVEHNTFVDTNTDARDVFHFWAAPGANELTTRNNIIYVTGRPVASHDGFTHTNNLYFVCGTASLVLTPHASELLRDPQLIDVSIDDFNLEVISPAIGAGTDLGYSQDYNGNGMPVDVTVDVGAYENQTGYDPPTPTILFDIDHEGGDLSEYDSTSGGVSATVGAALANTNYGMNVNITDQIADYGQVDLSLPGSGTIVIRLYIDTNGLTMALDDDFAFFRDDFSLLYVKFFHDGVNYNIGIAGDDDVGGWPLWIQTTITDAPHYIEIEYNRASSDVASDGSCQLRVDDCIRGTDTGIDNYDKWALVTWYRFGAVSEIDVGTSGPFYIDEIVANSNGYYIGP